MILCILITLVSSSNPLDIIANEQNPKHKQILGKSFEAYPFLLSIYESPVRSNISELIILANSSESGRLSLHYYKVSLEAAKIIENISPIGQNLANTTIAELGKLFNLDLYKSFKKVQIKSAQVQQIIQFERRFSLVELVYVGDANIYQYFAVLDKQQVIHKYSWALTSNRIKKIEASSIEWEIFSFLLSFTTGITFVYLFWIKTQRFPLLGLKNLELT